MHVVHRSTCRACGSSALTPVNRPGPTMGAPGPAGPAMWRQVGPRGGGAGGGRGPARRGEGDAGGGDRPLGHAGRRVGCGEGQGCPGRDRSAA